MAHVLSSRGVMLPAEKAIVNKLRQDGPCRLWAFPNLRGEKYSSPLNASRKGRLSLCQFGDSTYQISLSPPTHISQMDPTPRTPYPQMHRNGGA